MPLVLGGAAIAFLFLAILSLVTLYWFLTRWHDFAQGLVFPLNQLTRLTDYLRDRNAELLRDVVQVGHNLISWSIDRINDGFRILHDIYSAVVKAWVIAQGAQLIQIQNWIDHSANLFFKQLGDGLQGVYNFVHGYVQLNIDAFNYWKTQTTTLLDHVIIPNLNKLIIQMDHTLGITIPTIQARLGVAERTITQTLPAEIAEAKTDISAVQRELIRTTTAPRTGLLDRVGGIEKELAPVIPWAAAIGLSLPIAANLAKLGRNPCWCQQEGPLQDNGTLEMAMLMDLL
jgi:hypothetical protein